MLPLGETACLHARVEAHGARAYSGPEMIDGTEQYSGKKGHEAAFTPQASTTSSAAEAMARVVLHLTSFTRQEGSEEQTSQPQGTEVAGVGRGGADPVHNP